MTIIRNGLILKAVPPLGGSYGPDLLFFCWDKLNLNFYFHTSFTIFIKPLTFIKPTTTK